MRIDRLIDKIIEYNNPSCVGLDTFVEYLPESMREKATNFQDAAEYIFEFNARIIDEIQDFVPCIKPQSAYYEILGASGIMALTRTVEYAKKCGMSVILDVKRGDIGSTAEGYSKAYIEGIEINGKHHCAIDADFITVNGYLGSDGLNPFIKGCAKSGKGIFVLVKTSNPSSGEFQDKAFNDGQTLYETVGQSLVSLGSGLVGKYGFSSVGAVVGATYPTQSEKLRKQMPNTFFLVPGYGAQGASAKDLAHCFRQDGLGAIVASARAVICAYQKPQFKGLSYFKAAREAALLMREDLASAIKR